MWWQREDGRCRSREAIWLHDIVDAREEAPSPPSSWSPPSSSFLLDASSEAVAVPYSIRACAG